MTDTGNPRDFFEYQRRHYRGSPTLEIELKAVHVDPRTLRPSQMLVRAIVSLGIPKRIGCGLPVPDTIRFNVLFDAKRGGEMPWEEAIRQSVSQSLDKWFQGSSALLEAQAEMV